MILWTWGPPEGPRSVPHAAWRRDRAMNSCPYLKSWRKASSKWQHALLCHSLGSQSGYFHITGPRHCDSRMNGGIRIAEICVSPIGRIDDHQAAARESDTGIIRMNGEVSEQHFRNLQRLEPRMHHAALCRAADRVPHQKNAARPAMIGIRKRLQHQFQFIEAFVGRVDQYQSAALFRRKKGLERGVAVADFGSNSAKGLDLPLGGARFRGHQLDEERAILRAQAARDQRGRAWVVRQSLAAARADRREIVGKLR